MRRGIFRKLLSNLFSPVRKALAPPPDEKGARGENKIAGILRSYCKPPHERVVNDVILMDTQTGRSSQIDHILICARGVFVIETKNYSGMVCGSDRQREWTQVLAYGNTKHRFLSPVVQNATHVRLVRHILQEKFPVYGLVVFAQGNIEHIQSACVCAPYSVPERICTLSAGKAALNAAELDKIHSRILLHKNSYGVTKQEHMAHIRKLQQDLSSGICPRCGKPLALRHGKYGSFYGCSAYPKCKFTKPVR